VRFEVRVEALGAEHAHNLEELVLVVGAAEEVLLAEDLACAGVVSDIRHKKGTATTHHGGEHAASAPQVEAVVVALVADEQLWGLVVPRADTDMVLDARVVELRKAPIDEP
jgi:hypothetical protein